MFLFMIGVCAPCVQAATSTEPDPGSGIAADLEVDSSEPASIEEEYPKRELLFFEDIPVVISATKREQPITQSPSSISVITAEDIQRSGATNIADLLRRVPGLDVIRIQSENVKIGISCIIKPVLLCENIGQQMQRFEVIFI